MGNGFYKDERHHVVTVNPDVKTTKASTATTTEEDLKVGFVTGATAARGRGPTPVQPAVAVGTNRKRPR